MLFITCFVEARFDKRKRSLGGGGGCRGIVGGELLAGTGLGRT